MRPARPPVATCLYSCVALSVIKFWCLGKMVWSNQTGDYSPVVTCSQALTNIQGHVSACTHTHRHMIMSQHILKHSWVHMYASMYTTLASDSQLTVTHVYTCNSLEWYLTCSLVPRLYTMCTYWQAYLHLQTWLMSLFTNANRSTWSRDSC